MSSGSKPVTTIGHAVPRRERLVLRVAHHRADVPGGQEALHAVRRATTGSPPSPAAPARARPGSRSSSGPAARPGTPPSRWPARWSRSRRRRTPPAGRDSRARAPPRRAASRRCARRRRAALTVSRSRRRCRARAACRRTSRRSRPGATAISIALSISSSGVTHTGQPGPVHQRDLRRQQFVDAELDDGVGLPAADLHQRPRAAW